MQTSNNRTMTHIRRLNKARWLVIAVTAVVFLMPMVTEIVNAGCRPFSLLSLKPSILTHARVMFNDGPAVVCDVQSGPFGGGYNADFQFDLNTSHSLVCDMNPCDESGADGYGWLGGAGSGSGTGDCNGMNVLSNGPVGSWTIDFKVKFHQFQTDPKKKWGRITFSNMGNYYFLQFIPDGSSPTGWRCQNRSSYPGQWLDATSFMQELSNP